MTYEVTFTDVAPDVIDMLTGVRRCAWCRGELGPTVRRDARFCGQRCRQASHRFGQGAIARAHAAQPMTFAYADPPYPTNAHLYRDHPDYAGEVDHPRLVEQLTTGYPDGWALSTSARALPMVLSLLAGVDVRVAAWFRRPRPHATARWPISTWEPVIYHRGRPSLSAAADTSTSSPRDGSFRYDALICRSGPRTTDPGRVIGTKPAEFCYWLFDLLGALPGDTLDDLFPGSGGVARAWDRYTSLDVDRDTSQRDPQDASSEYSQDA